MSKTRDDISSSLSFESLSAQRLVETPGWWKIYESSFPLEEREPPAVIERGVRLGLAMALIARQQNAMVAIGATTLLRASRTIFLSYMAVAPGSRGHGIGGPLLEFAWETGKQRLAEMGLEAKGMILEVESPSLATLPEEARVRGRRIEFYRRRGAIMLSHPYIQPPIGTDVSIPMHLMYRGASQAVEPGMAEQQALIQGIYWEKYGAINGISDAILEGLIRRLIAARS